jgi:hypothetical protein
LRDTEADSVIIATKQSTSGRLLPILHALQKEFSYTDEAAELLIAEALNITRAEVHGSLPSTIPAPRRAGTSSSCVAPRLAKPLTATRSQHVPRSGLVCRWEQPRPMARHARAGLLRRRTAPAGCE